MPNKTGWHWNILMKPFLPSYSPNLRFLFREAAMHLDNRRAVNTRRAMMRTSRSHLPDAVGCVLLHPDLLCGATPPRLTWRHASCVAWPRSGWCDGIPSVWRDHATADVTSYFMCVVTTELNITGVAIWLPFWSHRNDPIIRIPRAICADTRVTRDT